MSEVVPIDPKAPEVPEVTYEWKQLNLVPMEEDSSMMKLKFWAGRIGVASAAYGIASDAFMIYQLMNTASTKAMGTAFLVFAILDLLWSVYHGKGSKEIVERDVVAEAYIDPGATKFMLLQSYGHFCFLKAITDSQTFGDKIIIGMYAGLREWFQIIVLDLPRFSMSLVLLTSGTNPSQLSVIAAALKIIGLYWSIFCLLVIIICYPFFKCCLACEPVDAVAIRRINTRIHDIVVEKKLLTTSPPESSKHATIEMSKVEEKVNIVKVEAAPAASANMLQAGLPGAVSEPAKEAVQPVAAAGNMPMTLGAAAANNMPATLG